MAAYADCPRCGETNPAWRVSEDGCPSCNDEMADALFADIAFRDDVRAVEGDRHGWSDGE